MSEIGRVSGGAGVEHRPEEQQVSAAPSQSVDEGVYLRDPTDGVRTEAPVHGQVQDQALAERLGAMLTGGAGAASAGLANATSAAAPPTAGAPAPTSSPAASTAAPSPSTTAPATSTTLDGVRTGGVLLRKGSRGAEVRELQEMLNRAGAAPPLDTDGKFGSKTRAAVREFQRSHGCKVDGIVGPETMRALDGGSSTTTRTSPTSPTAPGSGPAPTAPPPTTTTPTAPTAPTAPTGARGPTPFGSTPARDLSRDQARQELEALKAQGVLTFDPRSGGRIRLNFPIDGVDFRYKARSGPDTRSYALDPRMAVATVRLAQWAKAKGVTQITHRGFAGRSSADRHGQGRALDIAGFVGRDPQTGQAFEHDVAQDWGRAPRSGSGYRLDPSSDHGRFFQEAYQFLTTQFRDARSPSQIGGRSYVISPDHHSADLRRGHQDHFHVEVPPL